ncbi:MAG: efflux RND transporter periplasmic adaptor subunit [Bacteroidales bacterium]
MKSVLKISAVIILAVFASCTSKKNIEVENKEAPLVKIARVYRQPVEQIQDFTATVEANTVNNISSSMPLRIQSIKVEVGDRVSRGDVLVQMDNSNLMQSHTQLENLRVDYTREAELYKVGGISKQSLDSRKTQLDVAEAAYKQLSENTRLITPISGVVTARNYDNGDMVGSKPILTVEEIVPLKLKINVSESFYQQVKEGMPVKISVEAFEGDVFDGKVSLIYPTIDPNTRTFTVEVKLPNNNRKVRPGMFSRVTINFGMKQHVVVPDMAVIKQSGSGDRYVYVYKDSTVSYEKVEMGRRIDAAYELISGLEDGADVVVAGQSRLSNGIVVKVDTTAVK